jgi:fumarate reductase subunit C
MDQICVVALGWKMKSATTAPAYTLNHPRWYRKRVSTYWWLQRWEYLRFVLRELSSVFVAYFVLLTLFQIYLLSHGPQAYAKFQGLLKNPLMIAVNAVSFFFVVFHAVSWFNLSARAMAVRVGGKRIPGVLISGSSIVAWLVFSAVVAWFLLRG